MRQARRRATRQTERVGLADSSPRAIPNPPQARGDGEGPQARRGPTGTEYRGDASRIWNGSPPSATVVRRFLEFYGAGPKIATVATNILVRQFHVPLQDLYSVDVSVDRQLRRVMTRLGFVRQGASDLLLIYAAREAHPEFPLIFDLALWNVGRTICKPTDPRCTECQLVKMCSYAAHMVARRRTR